VNVDFVYVGAFSGWLEGKVKTPAGKAKRRGDSPAVRGKRSLARKSTVVSEVIHTGLFI